MKNISLILFLLPLNLYCQNLTGTWIGRETGSDYLKLVILQLGDSCFGYTYDEGPGFCQANFAGRFDLEKQKLKGRGVNFIARSLDHVLGVYSLNYVKNGDDEYLEGSVGVKGAGAAILSMGMTSFAQLKKITSQLDTTRFMRERISALKKKDSYTDTSGSPIENKQPVYKEKSTEHETVKAHSPDTLMTAKTGRVSKMVSTIYTNVDTVKMILYDNGMVDDDTVTVFFDNAIILDRYRITDKAKELFIPLTKNGQSHTIELFANNLGTIPPNTALIIIMAGTERYEVHASYDLSTNAKIIFQYKE